MYSVVINDIDAAMEVLVKKGADFASRIRAVSSMYRTRNCNFRAKQNHSSGILYITKTYLYNFDPLKLLFI